jgi:hypothetical protein
VWEEFECPQPELQQHTFNFFRYWLRAMPQFEVHIKEIKHKVFIDGSYDINMLMDPVTGMTLEAWVEYFNQAPGMLSHLKRKAKDWRKDYGGLTHANHEAIKRQQSDAAAQPEVPEEEECEVLGDISRNFCQNT